MSIFMYPIYNNVSSFKKLINATPSQSPSNSSVRSSIHNGTPPLFFYTSPSSRQYRIELTPHVSIAI
jgi:hypothetical protein